MSPPHAVRGESPPRRMASCVDVPRWANFRGHTCADYLAFNWCAGGRVLNASATGAIFGRPEWACCTCGAASAADVRAAGAVTNLFFIATHEVDDVDVRLFRYYQRALDCAEPRDKPHCAAVGGGHHASEISLWVLLYRSVNRFDGVAPSTAEVVRRDDVDANEQRRQSAAHGAEVAIWSERDVERVFPKVAHAIDRRWRHYRANTSHNDSNYLHNYYWFHTSLLVWNATYGHAYPNARYFWRLEPDVLYAGRDPLPSLVQRAAMTKVAWDVLSPFVQPRNNTELFPETYVSRAPYKHHWDKNAELLEGVPPAKQVHVLVCANRYSASFLRDTMGSRWNHGVVGYEEILLPVACLTDRRCSLAPFSMAKIPVKHLKYRISRNQEYWNCTQFLDALKSDSRDLWHPVKDRRCYADYVDALPR